jgi:hypothetical protein
MSKSQLLERGRKVMEEFCTINRIQPPQIYAVDARDWNVSACAYWRNNVTHICVARCASIGTAGPAWSYPGYTVDRSYWSDFSAVLRGRSGEKAITSYCPNDAEWFAEMFRVFVTNPDLLRLVRPRTYRELAGAVGLRPIFTDTWLDRLRDAPARTVAAAERQVERAAAEAPLL